MLGPSVRALNPDDAVRQKDSQTMMCEEGKGVERVMKAKSRKCIFHLIAIYSLFFTVDGALLYGTFDSIMYGLSIVVIRE